MIKLIVAIDVGNAFLSVFVRFLHQLPVSVAGGLDDLAAQGAIDGEAVA